MRSEFSKEIRTYLDLLSISQSGGKNVKTFTRWDHRLQIKNLFMTFNRALFPIGIEHLIYIKFFCYGSSNGY